MTIIVKSRIKLISYLLLVLLHELALAVTAGVLPYSQYQGKKVILLGVDHHRPGYWMDFGGKSDWNETAIETAAREFSEETMFCFFANIADVKNKLKYIAPIVVPNGYHMYPLMVPFIPDLNDIQRELRAHHSIKGQPGSGTSWLFAHHVEKIDYAWVWADDLKKAIVGACGDHKNVLLESIDGRHIKLHSILASTLDSSLAQKFLNGLLSKS